MNERTTHSDDWIECPPGTLNQVVQSAAQRRRANTITKTAVIGTLSCVVVLVYSLLFTENPSQPMRYGNISCHEVQEKMNDYRAGRLPTELAQQIETHLAQCPVCQDGLADPVAEQTFAKTTSVAANPRCLCPNCSVTGRSTGFATSRHTGHPIGTL